MSENSKTSFSYEVKKELLSAEPSGRHCRIAEIAALVAFLGFIKGEDDRYYLDTDNGLLNKKFFTLLAKTINISECANSIGEDEFQSLLELIKFSGEGLNAKVNDILLQQECCRKAFIRGAFLATGSISDPNKSYYLSIATENETLSKQLFLVFEQLGISAKITKRKNTSVLYLKEGTMLVESLGLMGAPLSLMKFENVRIIKDIRNNLNRKVNAETANLKKTIEASMDQIVAIDYIDKKVGLSELPDSLREVAILRRKNPEVSLQELGQMLNPGVGKSGINHRLRRIVKFAEALKKEETENEKRSSS